MGAGAGRAGTVSTGKGRVTVMLSDSTGITGSSGGQDGSLAGGGSITERLLGEACTGAGTAERSILSIGNLFSTAAALATEGMSAAAGATVRGGVLDACSANHAGGGLDASGPLSAFSTAGSTAGAAVVLGRGAFGNGAAAALFMAALTAASCCASTFALIDSIARRSSLSALAANALG